MYSAEPHSMIFGLIACLKETLLVAGTFPLDSFQEEVMHGIASIPKSFRDYRRVSFGFLGLESFSRSMKCETSQFGGSGIQFY